jgi:hypothetical protein
VSYLISLETVIALKIVLVELIMMLTKTSVLTAQEVVLYVMRTDLATDVKKTISSSMDTAIILVIQEA